MELSRFRCPGCGRSLGIVHDLGQEPHPVCPSDEHEGVVDMERADGEILLDEVFTMPVYGAP